MIQFKIKLKFLDAGRKLLKNTPIDWSIGDGDGAVGDLASGAGPTGDDGILELDAQVENRLKYKLFWAARGESGTSLILPTQLGVNYTKPVTLTGRSYEVSNPKRNWLTYETRFNWAPFAKTDQSIEFLLYRVNAADVLLILAPACDLEDPVLNRLREVFFPELDTGALRAFGRAPWEGQRDPVSPASVAVQNTSRVEQVLYAGPYAVLPYNIRDNTSGSAAIGTLSASRVRNLPLRRLPQRLRMWNTASRSCVAKIEGTIDPKAADPIDGSEANLWGRDTHPLITALRFLEPKPTGGELCLADEDMGSLFSLKTGVDIIGFNTQASKAKLEHNSILAALRSAYIRQLEAELFPDALVDATLLVLTEIMTVTEVDPQWDAWLASKMGDDNPCGWQASATPAVQPTFGDGFQVRSLRGMKSDCEYFPPTSIPFVGVQGGAVSDQSKSVIGAGNVENKIVADDTNVFLDGMPFTAGTFAHVSDPTWVKFWETHYAVALGRTKARLLLRYGLQGFGGNAQNFLLEMKDGVPNGRVVVRDMGDYALHDVVLWALFGPGGPPPEPRTLKAGQQEAIVSQWRDAFRSSKSKVAPLLWFECKVLHEYLGEDGVSEFPTFTGYHRTPKSGMHTLNPLCACCEPASGTAPFVGHISPLWAYALPVSSQRMTTYNCDLTAARWAEVFEVESRWGIEHAKAWIGYISTALGPDFVDKVASKFEWAVVKMETIQGGDYSRMHDPGDYSDPAFLGVDLTQAEGKLKVQDPGFSRIQNKWDSLYKHMKNWEIYLGWQVENYLMTPEGQDAIRKYARGGYVDVEKTF